MGTIHWRETPRLGLGPTVMKEFSFLDIFASVLRCAGNPLPTHLYANETSHKLGMLCPQILSTMYRWAWLLQIQEQRGAQLLPALISWQTFSLFWGGKSAKAFTWL